MSKAVRTIVSVAAAVAIPFVAPYIASSIGLSTAIGGAVGSATAGSAIGGALTGAALGAAKGAVLGEDVGRNALMGSLGGGIGGYTQAPTAPPDPYSLAGGASPTAAGPLAAPGYAPVDYSLAAGTQLPTMGVSAGSSGIGFAAPDPGFYGTGLSGAMAQGVPGQFGLGSYAPSQTGLSVASVNPLTGGTQVSTGMGTFQSASPTSSYASGSYGSSAAPAMASAGLAPPKTFAEALSRVPGEIAGRFSDPKALADLTLRAAGQLAGSAFASEGLSAEEQEMLNAQAEELRGLQATNRALFDQKLQAAQDLIGGAKYFDPEYFGLQSARRSQLAGARAKQAGLRGLVGDRREAESRRFDLAIGRDTGTAFDTGYRTGVQGQLQTQQAGLSAMPGYLNYQTPATSALMAGQAAGRARRKEDEAGISKLFGSITGLS